MTRRRSTVMLAILVAGATVGLSSVQRGAPSTGATARAVAAADAFLATLDPAQRKKANIDLNEKTRTIWSNLPTGTTMQVGATERNGIKLGDLNPAQEKAALALVASTLSRDGFQKAMAIVDADQVLETRTAPTRKGSAVRFGHVEYYVSILGKPSTTDPWMIQFGGHHLAINVTLAGRENVLTPTHTGTQPASYSLDGKTVRPLGGENDKAFALVNALNADQQKQAILSFDVRNLVLGPGTDGKTIAPEGVRVSTFTPQQRTMLTDLAGEWVEILGDEAAAAKMKEVQAVLATPTLRGPAPPRTARARISGFRGRHSSSSTRRRDRETTTSITFTRSIAIRRTTTLPDSQNDEEDHRHGPRPRTPCAGGGDGASAGRVSSGRARVAGARSNQH